ncbi:hypothetical protein SEA_SKOG_70 [Gordonia phage Skog]|uniref:Uncharacterized protein n=1 Tax=Gordonia phage Skog TaxID=2704033 RepID=A0A6G6XJE7_9CAUD|nr:hypothetical protein KHQ85_gp070 [Gordonia phage Skog]QIG58222.1 hypothetical protein SEA_SKOG_70 [Gordonia phage Skog]
MSDTEKYARFPFPRDLHARWKIEAAHQGKTLTGLLRDIITVLEKTRDEKRDETPITSTTVGASWSAESTTPVDKPHGPDFTSKLPPLLHDGLIVRPEGEPSFNADLIRAKLGRIGTSGEDPHWAANVEPYVSEHPHGSDEWWANHPLNTNETSPWCGEVNPFGPDAHYIERSSRERLLREIERHQPEETP